MYDFAKTGDLIRSAKIVIGDNQFQNSEGFLSDRFFNSLAAGGAMLMHQKVEKLEELTGFKNGKHYIEWTDLEDLKRKIELSLEEPERFIKRSEIAKEGTYYVETRHSFDNRVSELEAFLKELPKTKKRSISTMMICRDEIKHIERVVGEANQFSSQVVVVDTGSVDGTIEKLHILESEGKCEVHRFEWINDFSIARNFAKKKCKSDWVFWMDCDDHIPPRTITSLQKFDTWDFSKQGRNFPSAFRFLLIDHRNGSPGHCALQFRMFLNLPNIFWRGEIHEILDKSIDDEGFMSIDMHMTEIHHISTDDPVLTQKKQIRNLNILRDTNDSPRKFYYIGQCFASSERYGDALMWWQKALNMVDTKNKMERGYLMFCCGYMLYEAGIRDEAIKFLEKTSFPDAIYLMATYDDNPYLYYQYVQEPVPADYSSFSKAWVPKAKAKLKEWCGKVLEEIC